MIRVFLLLGSNEGDRTAFLSAARAQIEAAAGKVISISSVYQTAAWGKTDQAAFLNQVIAVDTKLEALVLLGTLQTIERAMGRKRKEKWGSRTIDIDILFYGDAVINTTELIVPHPGIPERRFTLVPLVEIAPDLLHPVLKKTVRELLGECGDGLEVEKI
jgi:2-amino-4-hydroxy-6-hydroxymethyldihydropteridine diphosphokinase